jgi:hypothetical protein
MLQIEFKKGRDKDILVCTRSNGSSTWMQTDRFFTVHDLAHYVVEKTLNFKQGFYGLIESGINITDFEDKQKFKPREMPLEAAYAENLVGLLMTELSDERWTTDFQQTFNDICTQFGHPQMEIEQSTLTLLRSELRELIDHWKSLPVQKTLLLNF